MKLSKTLLSTIVLTPALIAPATSLSSCSCSNTWAHYTPLAMGSANKSSHDNPYYNFITDLTSTYLDADGKDMIDYLQSNYLVKRASSSNYAYSQPMEFVDDESKEDDWTLGTSGWYQSSSDAFKSQVTDKHGDKKDVKTNARNANLASNVDFVSTIGSTISNYFLFALQYQAQQINAKEPTKEENLNIAWGSKEGFVLDHGSDRGEAEGTLRQFFEYIFATSNVNGKKKTNAQFNSSVVSFNFQKDFFPLPTYTFDGDGKRTGLDARFVKLLEGADGTLAEPKYYSKKTDLKEDDDGNKYNILTYENVPIVINVNGLQQTYTNPSKKDNSFLVNDYYSSDEDITKAVGNSWQENLPKFTGIKKEQAVPYYNTYNLKTIGGLVLDDLGTTDARLTDLKGNQFVALINYAVNYYPEKQELTTATISGLSNLFPAYFLELNKDVYKEANKDTKVSIIDSGKINKVADKYLGIVKRTSKEGTKPHASDLSEESQKLISFLGFMFANEGTINTSEILQAIRMK